MSLARKSALAFATLGIALISACPALASCPLPLQPRFTLSTGSGPVEVVAADFNEDGIPDLVTGHYFSSSLGLFLGNAPGGTFGVRSDISVGSTPQALLAADLDGDGHQDVVVSCWGSNFIQVLRGLGNGSFQAPVSFPAGASPYEIALGDFNADGVKDVAVADNAERSMRILIGGKDGSGHWDGSFAPSVRYDTNNLPLGITTGDFNQDGITDVVVTEYNDNTVALFLGNGSGGLGDGTFQSAAHIPCGVIPYDLATGDFNHDGHLDLVVANSGDGGTHVLFGSGTGSFPSSTALLPGVNCSGVAPAELDGDGITDLLVSSAVSPNQLFMLRGRGAGGFGDGTFESPVTFEDCCYAVHVMTADLNLDGRPDAVTCDWTSNTLSVFMGGCGPDVNRPAITRLRDVPNDQGGKVFITWTKSALDATGGAVNGYTVWRLVPPVNVVARLAALAGPLDPASLRRELRTRADGATDIEYWEALATLPAQRLPGYGYTAATPQDSLPDSNPLFTYRVSATTANIDVFYDSDPDSGYSVDNIPPSTPGSLTASWNAGGAQLHWQANSDPDFEHYAVYRSEDPAFTPSPTTLVATPLTNTFEDASPHPSATYKLAAVDKHGNPSAYASVNMSAVTGVGEGRAGTTWLASPWPNPARGPFDLRFGLAREARVTLVVMDAQGRRVRTLAEGVRPAGDTVIRWDARDESGVAVGAGLYWLDLKTGPQHLVQRFALVR